MKEGVKHLRHGWATSLVWVSPCRETARLLLEIAEFIRNLVELCHPRGVEGLMFDQSVETRHDHYEEQRLHESGACRKSEKHGNEDADYAR